VELPLAVDNESAAAFFSDALWTELREAFVEGADSCGFWVF
jgi:hypothetical protein